MSLLNNRCAEVLSYVIYDIRERYEHAKREITAGKSHIYKVDLPLNSDTGRPVLTADILSDVLFEERIFNLRFEERRTARIKRARYFQRQARETGKLVSITEYCRKKYAWPEIDPEMEEVIARTEAGVTDDIMPEMDPPEGSTVSTVEPDMVTTDVETVSTTTTKHPGTAAKTPVEELLENTEDESIRRQIVLIFENNPELRDLANSERYSLKFNISEDGRVTVGSARRIAL